MQTARRNLILTPMYRVAIRQWLLLRTLPPGTGSGLVTQGLIWTGLTLLLVWGLVGLIASPLGT